MDFFGERKSCFVKRASSFLTEEKITPLTQFTVAIILNFPLRKKFILPTKNIFRHFLPKSGPKKKKLFEEKCQTPLIIFLNTKKIFPTQLLLSYHPQHSQNKNIPAIIFLHL